MSTVSISTCLARDAGSASTSRLVGYGLFGGKLCSSIVDNSGRNGDKFQCTEFYPRRIPAVYSFISMYVM